MEYFWIRYKNKDGILFPDISGNYYIHEFLPGRVTLGNINYDSYRVAFYLSNGLLTFREPRPLRAYRFIGGTSYIYDKNGRYHIVGKYPDFHCVETGHKVWIDAQKFFHTYQVDYVSDVQTHTRVLRYGSVKERVRKKKLLYGRLFKSVEAVPHTSIYIWKVRSRNKKTKEMDTLAWGEEFYRVRAGVMADKWMSDYRKSLDKTE